MAAATLFGDGASVRLALGLFPATANGKSIDGKAKVMCDWVQLEKGCKCDVLLILPCNDGAAHGNYFIPINPRKKGWNAWREADKFLSKLRKDLKTLPYCLN